MRTWGTRLAWLLLLLPSWLVLGCRDPKAPSPSATSAASPARAWLTELEAPYTGLDVVMTSGRTPSTQILEVKGGGMALIDFDSDGDSDVFVPNGAYIDRPEAGPGCRLFRNDGGFRFVDVTRRAGLSLRRWGFGVAVGDVDADGHDDIFVACYGPNVLLRNRGDGTFEDVSDRAGVADRRWGTGCAFGDVDGDGDLDLYVCNYLYFNPVAPPRPTMFKATTVFGGPVGAEPQQDQLLLNRGDGTFVDATEPSGVGAPRPAFALNAVIADLDGDGDQDVFVGNDSMESYLFRNRGGAVFDEVGTEAGVAMNGDGLVQATMGIAVADVNADGLPDLFTTNFSGDTNTLHVSVAPGAWEDRTLRYGLGRESMPFVGWACGLEDFDLDGDEDLLIVNGHVYPQASLETMDSPYEQTPLLYERRAERFERLRFEVGGAWLARAHCDRTAVFGDLDGDGDCDVLVGELNDRPRALRNDAAPGASSSHWLAVQLADRRPGVGNRHGLGAMVEVTDALGRRRRRWIVGGGPFQSTGSSVAIFGLGERGEDVSVKVVWPDGHEGESRRTEVDRRLVVERR